MNAIPILPPLRSIVVGAPSYFEERSLPRTGRPFDAPVYPGALTLDDSGHMLVAALADSGLAYLEERAVRQHVADESLIVVPEEWTPPFPGLSLFFASRRYMPAHLRAIVDLREWDGVAMPRTRISVPVAAGHHRIMSRVNEPIAEVARFHGAHPLVAPHRSQAALRTSASLIATRTR